jgi:hypothetical protein
MIYESKVEIIAETLRVRFGLPKKEAAQLAKEIDNNLRNYLVIQEIMIRRKAK